MVRGKGNSLSTEFLDVLISALDAEEASYAAAIVLTGEGRTFSAGVDLPAVVAGGADYLRAFLPALGKFLQRLTLFPKPVVAAVNGHAIAGGAIGMLACDYRLLARGRARIGLTELLVGVAFPTWPVEIARHFIPREHFQSLIYTGRTVLPDESLAMGLVDELIEPAELLDRACAVAKQLGEVPSATFRFTKEQLRRPLIEAVERRAAIDDLHAAAIWSSPEALRKIDEFVRRTIGRGETN
jgi:enoyl-CoA hydratase/carnithine racemase